MEWCEEVKPCTYNWGYRVCTKRCYTRSKSIIMNMHVCIAPTTPNNHLLASPYTCNPPTFLSPMHPPTYTWLHLHSYTHNVPCPFMHTPAPHLYTHSYIPPYTQLHPYIHTKLHPNTHTHTTTPPPTYTHSCTYPTHIQLHPYTHSCTQPINTPCSAVSPPFDCTIHVLYLYLIYVFLYISGYKVCVGEGSTRNDHCYDKTVTWSYTISNVDKVSDQSLNKFFNQF